MRHVIVYLTAADRNSLVEMDLDNLVLKHTDWPVDMDFD